MKHTFLLFFCLLSFACNQAEVNKTFVANSGDIVYLNAGSEYVPATFDKDSLLKVENIVSSSNKQPINEMISSGKVAAVKSDTKAKVVETGLATQVRILEGAHENKIVWVDVGWLKLSPSN